MQKPSGDVFDFSLDTTLEEELEKERERQVRKTQVETGDDPLSFLLGSVPAEPKKPKRIIEFESIFDVSKLIEDKSAKKTSTNGSPAQAKASLFLTGGDEEDFLRLVEQSSKKANSNSRAAQQEEEDEEPPYEEPPKPTPSEMCHELETFPFKDHAPETASATPPGEDNSESKPKDSEEAAEGSDGHTTTTTTVATEDHQTGSADEAVSSPALTEREVDIPRLTQKALDRELVHTKTRGLLWKLFLGLLGSKPAEWTGQLEEHRTTYDALHKRYMVDPHAEGRELDPAINNPLSQSEESPWQQYFQDAELKKQIVLDIRRVYPENGFFRDKDLQEMMLRVLFIYAREHPDILYKQGMHELLAPVLYVLHREAIGAAADAGDDAALLATPTGQVISLVNASRYIEHDAYALFDRIMEHTGSWFLSGSRGPSASPELEAQPFGDPHAHADNSIASPVVVKCKRIQQELLRRADPQLFQYLTDLSIEPQLYALRWVRLLLGREFHLEDVLRLWDAIFAYGKGLALVDYIIVAMLMYIRESVLGREYTACLQRLFKYPPVEDVPAFITKALALMNPKKLEKKSPSTLTLAATNPLEATTVAQQSQSGEVDATTPAVKSAEPPKQKPSTAKEARSEKQDRASSPTSHRHSLTDTLKHLIPEPKSHRSKSAESPAVTALHNQVSELTARVEELSRTQTHMSTRLERIIFSLHNGFVEKKNVLSEDERMDSVLLALAELKQIKDILTGLLPLDAQQDAFENPITSAPVAMSDSSSLIPLSAPAFVDAADPLSGASGSQESL